MDADRRSEVYERAVALAHQKPPKDLLVDHVIHVATVARAYHECPFLCAARTPYWTTRI